MVDGTYELVLFDMDGTLLGPDRRIRGASIEAIRFLMAGGVRVGLATGRSPASVVPFVDIVRPDGPCILFNGAMVWDPITRLALSSALLPKDDALTALRITEAIGMHANLYLGDDLFVSERTPISLASEEKDGMPHIDVGPLSVYLERSGAAPSKLLLIDESNRFDAFIERFRAEAGDRCTLVNSEPTYLEILPEGLTKGAALANIDKIAGIPARRVMAFGDGKNDIELLRDAGLGVAMENGDADALEVADRVIGRHDTDAIAEFLGRYAIDGGRLRFQG